MEESKVKGFPSISDKLTAPTKKSVFERQKAEAEAKRQREEAETAAVYEDFIKSFDDDGTPASGSNSIGTVRHVSAAPLAGRGGLGGGPKRHFAPSAPRGISGPGSLGHSSSLSRKRALDGSHPHERNKDTGLFAFENSAPAQLDAFQQSEDEEGYTGESKAASRVVAKPSLHLSSLPPGTSPAMIKSWIPSTLTVDAVRILPPAAPGSTDRKSSSAIVTLGKDTPGSKIDAAVNTLSGRYLGRGFYLSISRHLSTAALGTSDAHIGGLLSSSAALPFGAKTVYQGPGGALNRAPPPSVHRGGYAPPASYNTTGPGSVGRNDRSVQVKVMPPAGIKQIRLINKTVEAVLTHGPQIEALLMSRPDVQRDEKWTWIWDPRSPGGVWYRWRLWQILSGSEMEHPRGGRVGGSGQKNIFETGAPWSAPDNGLRFEFMTQFNHLVSDSEYNSSEEDESCDESRPRHTCTDVGPGDGLAGQEETGRIYLNPLRKAKLTHLLARLPTSTARLRKGDVARATAFAIRHAGEGADEVVDMILSNIERPFAWSGANPHRKREAEQAEQGEQSDEADRKQDRGDVSASKLIALYVASDILSSSSTSGVRHAWRYRQLFEAAFTQRKIFEGLGRLEKELQWGRLRGEKWKRSVSNLLSLWEGWCVFSQAAQEHFAGSFMNPASTPAERDAAATAAAAAEESAKVRGSGAARSRWKTVDVNAQSSEAAATAPEGLQAADVMEVDEDVDGQPMEDLDGEPMDDIDGEPMDDIDGSPLDAEDVGEPMEATISATKESEHQPSAATLQGSVPSGEPPRPEEDEIGGPRRRAEVVDMFADSDDE